MGLLKPLAQLVKRFQMLVDSKTSALRLNSLHVDVSSHRLLHALPLMHLYDLAERKPIWTRMPRQGHKIGRSTATIPPPKFGLGTVHSLKRDILHRGTLPDHTSAWIKSLFLQ